MTTSTRFLAALCAGAVLSFSLLAQQGPAPKSQKELDALIAIQNSQDMDAQIAASTKFIQDFADSDFRSRILMSIMQAYEMKGDIPNTVAYAEQLLAAKPSPFEAASAHIRIANGVVRQTKEFDLDREEKLKTVADNANKAIALLPTATKINPDFTDEQWTSFVKQEEALAYDSLAQGEFVRKKYDEAAAFYVKAIDAQSDPVRKLKAGNAYRMAKKYNEALSMLDSAISDPQASAQVKDLAENEKKQVQAAQTQGA